MQMQGRRRILGSTALALLLATTGRAAAQTPAPAAVDAPAASPAVDARADEVWSAYHEAFAALVRGDRGRGRQLLDAIVLLHPTHPAAALARSLAAMLGAPTPASSGPGAGPALPPGSRDGKTNTARAELIVFQTLHGVAAGFELCAAAECAGVRAHAVSLMAMGGLGLGLSIGLTGGGVRPGDTAALDAGAFWGFWNGLSVAGATEATPAHRWRGMLVGQGLGLGAGFLYAIGARPTAGQVSLSSTIATWSTTMMALVLVAASNQSHSAKDVWVPLLLASDVGLVAGSALGGDSSISRGRAALIDVGGALGLLFGALVSVGGHASDQRAGLTMMAGTGAGLVCATLATWTWDEPATGSSPPPGLPATLNLVPTPTPGGGAGLTLGGTF